ncbi:MAG: SURF1 family protein [Thiobacillus sp.]|nr:SURF1 family protein [Thiobacillus sp.]OGA77218.1 MAG: transmembrane cytochrome oxidase [Burkholderiales bacterium GWE1_65_30]OGA90678.1 MAG: transmembrane cytochrome oxidase [Burkholderiales bacterium GWF1_66_17]OGB30177.1 MAG: transmembrane cytochrome oxidase [Burkholderiales bacterium RIFCSPLOWO2_02_FULL_66_35]
MSTRPARFWVVTLATVITMAVTAALGFWQLDRAGQKRALQAQIEQRGQLAPWSTPELLQAADPLAGLHRPVQLSGRWVQGASLFLDNRQMNARVGFFVITPLRLAGSDRAILVQRGWVARDFNDRSRVPVVDTPEGDVRLEGRLAPPPGRLFQLGESGSGPIRQNVDIPGLALEFGVSLLDVSVLQTGNADDGLQRDWPRIAAGVEKHHGYAFQWFGLCTLAGGLYVWFQFISPRRKRNPHGPEAR